jgi:hypothetical protein
LLNSDRFPATMSLHGVGIMLDGLRLRAAALPQDAAGEGQEYANRMGKTLLTEARHLLFTVRVMALHQPGNFDTLIQEILALEDQVDQAVAPE